MATCNVRVNSGLDDGWYNSNYSTFTSGEDPNFGNNSGLSRHAAVAFRNVTIPVGSTINSAKITFQSNANRSGTTCNVKIYAVDEDDFSLWDTPEPTKTTAYSSWDNVGSWTSGSNYDTPSIVSVIQEIIDRAGWASGNDIGILIIDNSSSTDAIRSFDGYDSDSANAAYLQITYTEPTSGPAHLSYFNGIAAANIDNWNNTPIENMSHYNQVD